MEGKEKRTCKVSALGSRQLQRGSLLGCFRSPLEGSDAGVCHAGTAAFHR